ncbi:hypothetical protein Tco_0047056 [Tanacetum coccineum]
MTMNLKGVSYSKPLKTIAFLSTDVQRLVICKTSTAEQHISKKDITQAISSKKLQMMKMLGRIDIRWQWTMITGKAKEVFERRKAGEIWCQERRNVAIEDSKPQPSVAQTTNEDIDWTKNLMEGTCTLDKMHFDDLTGATKLMMQQKYSLNPKQYFHILSQKECNDKFQKQTWRPKGNYLDSVNRGNPRNEDLSSAWDAQGSPTQSVSSQVTASEQDAFQTIWRVEGTFRYICFKQGSWRDFKKQTLAQAKFISQAQGQTQEPGSQVVAPVVKASCFLDVAITPNLERKSDETEEVNIEEKEASNVKSGETEELDLETTQSTARQGTITPRTLNFEDEAGPSSPLRPIQVMDSEEQHNAAEVLVSISRPRGLSIPGPIQTQPQQPTQGTDPKDKGKGILVEEPKKKKLTLQQIRALETTNDEEVARKFKLSGCRRRKKELSRKRKATITEEQPSKKPKLRSETIDELRNYLRVVDFEKNAQDKESLEGISMITELQVIDSPDGEYLIIHRANNHFRLLTLLWEILQCLALLGDLNIIWETAESSDDDFWKDQEEWEIIRWRFHESSGVHTLEIEDGTMIHMLAERRYPLSRELMIRMLDHGMEVEEETETAITLIHLFILWTTEDGDNS